MEEMACRCAGWGAKVGALVALPPEGPHPDPRVVGRGPKAASRQLLEEHLLRVVRGSPQGRIPGRDSVNTLLHDPQRSWRARTRRWTSRRPLRVRRARRDP